MSVKSVEADFLFTQDSKSSFFNNRKYERGRRKRARGKRIRRIATYSSMT